MGVTHGYSGGRHHVFVKVPPKQVQLAEVGPRFEMKRKYHSVIRRYSLAHDDPQQLMKLGKGR